MWQKKREEEKQLKTFDYQNKKKKEQLETDIEIGQVDTDLRECDEEYFKVNLNINSLEEKIKGQNSYFSVSTETSREVALTNVGDTVSIKFIKVGDGEYIITNSFENLTLEQ